MAEKALVSVVIRTLNEERFLGELLQSISKQRASEYEVEVVIIDSGSTDQTLDIAKAHGCRVTHIEKERFTFGRSLNEGCEFSRGDYLVFISGHCIPSGQNWLDELVGPLLRGSVGYTYGRQVGRAPTKFSENQLFKKYYPSASCIPQDGFFVNNANSAISRGVWERYRFDEELTGLEDMDLAKRLIADGGAVGYCAAACVFHIHDESWKQIQRRYEREAYALQYIMPEVQVDVIATIRYVLAGVLHDFSEAVSEGVFLKEFVGIARFRLAQYVGTYKGNHIHRKLSRERRESYFYPRPT